jgi:hypothetical protein
MAPTECHRVCTAWDKLGCISICPMPHSATLAVCAAGQSANMDTDRGTTALQTSIASPKVTLVTYLECGAVEGLVASCGVRELNRGNVECLLTGQAPGELLMGEEDGGGVACRTRGPKKVFPLTPADDRG